MWQSAKRALAILLQWVSAGRSGEVAWLTWDQLEWDSFFTCTFATISQTKVSKDKIIAMVAGRDRHGCAYQALAAMLCLVEDRGVYKTDTSPPGSSQTSKP